MVYRLAFLSLLLSGPLLANGPHPLIIGGNDASGHWPWAARVEIAPPVNAICSGSLFHENWIITAAHCLFNENGEMADTTDITVYVGSGRKGTNPSRDSSAYYVHPGYDNDARFIGHDIALIRLSAPIQVTALPSLVDDEHFAALRNQDATGRDEAVTAIGWGITNPDTLTASDTVQQADLDYVPFPTCNQHWDGRLTGIADSVLCASELNPEAGRHQSTCYGDSGGPLILNGTTSAYIIGLTSFGATNDCQAGRPGVFNRVINMVDFVEHRSGLVDVVSESEHDRYYGAPGEQVMVSASVRNGSVNAGNDASNVSIAANIDTPDIGATLQWDACSDTPRGSNQCTLSSLSQGSRSNGQVRLSHGGAIDTAAVLTLVVHSEQGEYRIANNRKPVNVIFSNRPDLTVNAEQTSGVLDSNGQGVATIAVRVSNLSTMNAANGATVKLTLPVGTTARGDDSVQCDTLCWIGPVAPGVSVDFTLTLTSGTPETGTLTMTTADQNGGDFPEDNNRSELSVTYFGATPASGSSSGSGGGGSLTSWWLFVLAGLARRRPSWQRHRRTG